MNSSTMIFLTIKEAAELTGKSESTIKRFVRETKKNHPKKYSSNKCFKFEKLSTGHEKILIAEDFLKENYSTVQNTNLNSSNEPLSEPLNNTVNQTLIEYLKQELDRKNDQIAEKDKQIESLLDRNKEINLLFAQAQQREQIKLEESNSKKRWWQRNKGR